MTEGRSQTHHESSFPPLLRHLGSDFANQPLLVIDQEGEARRPSLLDLLLPGDNDIAKVQQLPNKVEDEVDGDGPPWAGGDAERGGGESRVPNLGIGVEVDNGGEDEGWEDVYSEGNDLVE